MKYFHEFNPLQPFNHEESLQILNNRVRLSYIPLKDSVSIQGFLQESILGDVKSNSFWCDYRDYDGYRSANGELFFDSSKNGDVVNIKYLGVGTVLRADDMNEIADRLDSLNASSESLQSDILNQRQLIKNIENHAVDALSNHDSNPNSHQDLRQSIVDMNDIFNYRLDTINQSFDGMKKSIDSSFDSVHAEIESSKIDSDSIIAEANQFTSLIHVDTLEKFVEVQRQFDGIYNAIDNGDEYLESKIARLGSNIENQFAVERLSAQNQIKSLKDELYQRIDTQSTIAADSVRTELIEVINSDDPLVDSVMLQVSKLRDEFDLITSKYYILDNRIETENQNRVDADSILADSISAVVANTSSQFDSVTANVAELSKTLYQARNAINNELDSLSADVNIANMNLINSREMFDRKVDEIKDLDSVLREEFDNMLDDFELQMNSKQEEFESDMQEIMESVDSSYDSLLTDFTNNFQSLSGMFYQTYSSLNVALVDVENMKADIVESIQSAVDDLNDELVMYTDERIEYIGSEFDSKLANLSDSVQNSINTLDDTTEQSINSILSSISALNDRISSAAVSIDNVNSNLGKTNSSLATANTNISNAQTSIGTLNTKATNIQTSLGTTNTNVANAQSSIGTLKTSITSAQTSIGTLNSTIGTVNSRYQTSVGVLAASIANKPVVLSTTNSTVAGGIWYST